MVLGVNMVLGVVAAVVGKVRPQRKEATLIDGKKIAATITAEVKADVDKIREQTGKVPGLAVLIVGSRKDSQTYVNMKKKKCDELGILSFGCELPETATEAEVLAKVKEFNADPRIDGILVQLPLPKHINEKTVLEAISLDKDVDGFHPLNIGALSMKGRDPLFVACTPLGCMELLKRSGVQVAGKNAVVVGRSNIVGMPAAMLLLKADATVTVVHSRTPNPETFIRTADIIIACCGVAQFVQGAWVKPGAVIIDVGTNPLIDPSKKAGFRLVGDVDFASAKKVASMITPVPGGVGPMTIAMLMRNTADSSIRTLGVKL